MHSIDLIELAELTEFRQRVKVGLQKICHDIVFEENTTENSNKRQPFAVQILNNTDGYVNRFCLSLVTQPAICQNLSVNKPFETIKDTWSINYTGSQVDGVEFDKIDVEIQSVIPAIFNDIAGVTSI